MEEKLLDMEEQMAGGWSWGSGVGFRQGCRKQSWKHSFPVPILFLLPFPQETVEVYSASSFESNQTPSIRT